MNTPANKEWQQDSEETGSILLDEQVEQSSAESSREEYRVALLSVASALIEAAEISITNNPRLSY